MKNFIHKIGIISDTHGKLRKEVMEALEGCEMIFHGGDINKQSILDELEEIAPVYVVRGNNDKDWAEHIPQTLQKNIYGLDIFMIHNKSHIPKNLAKVDLIIYGHSHKYDDRIIDGIHYLNPGSCGPRRFDQEISMAVMKISSDGDYEIEKILIPNDKGSGKKSKETHTIPADIADMIPAIMKECDAGKNVAQIARKHKLSKQLTEQIVRMYMTHPGVDVDGILRRIGL